MAPTPRFAAPQAYTPQYLAEKILTSRSALVGERKQVTVLFADLRGSLELLADRDPEEVRQLLDPVLERLMAAVHRYEGTVNQVMGDGIMALFGVPLAMDAVADGGYHVRAVRDFVSSPLRGTRPRHRVRGGPLWRSHDRRHRDLPQSERCWRRGWTFTASLWSGSAVA
jgi:class 3 adenylate cyclase